MAMDRWMFRLQSLDKRHPECKQKPRPRRMRLLAQSLHANKRAACTSGWPRRSGLRDPSCATESARALKVRAASAAGAKPGRFASSGRRSAPASARSTAVSCQMPCKRDCALQRALFRRRSAHFRPVKVRVRCTPAAQRRSRSHTPSSSERKPRPHPVSSREKAQRSKDVGSDPLPKPLRHRSPSRCRVSDNRPVEPCCFLRTICFGSSSTP